MAEKIAPTSLPRSMSYAHGMRELPSLIALQSFEASLRFASFSRAADELGRTQGAVSRQIAKLEQQLGVQLFVRANARLHATPAARSFGAKLSPVLDRLAALTLELQSTGGAASVLQLAILPTFGTRWLIPRIADFHARHPEVAVQLTTRIGRFDFESVGIDAAIHHGEAVWAGARLEPLMHEEVSVVCTPTLAARLRAAEDLRDETLLQLVSRRAAWFRWFEEQGVASVDARRGPLFEHHLMVIQAARSGLGVALLPLFLIQDELDSGVLVEPLPQTRTRGPHAYYLASPESGRDLPGLAAFRSWIHGELAPHR